MSEKIFPTNLPLSDFFVNEIFTYSEVSDGNIPEQGWKIHISSTMDNYQVILNKVSEVCLKYRIPFKFINTEAKLFFILSKRASQIEIGKFITIYPLNDKLFLKLLSLLHEEIKGEEGVQVQTDRNYKDSQVIYYRYGVMKMDLGQGERPYLKDKKGNEYIDIKGPYYSCPEFVMDYFPEEDDDIMLLNDRYDMQSIIHQSGSGNIYNAVDLLTNKTVVIKEARKFVYVTRELTAIDLLRNETRILKRLFGLHVPNFIDDFYVNGNYYLVEELIEGVPLSLSKDNLNLLVRRSFEEQSQFNYCIESIVTGAIQTLKKIHRRGVILEDISLSNMLTTPKNEIFFIDFETSYLDTENKFVSTTNVLHPSLLDVVDEKKDMVKFWYCVIGLLTNADSMLKYDKTGQKTLSLFIRMCIEMKLSPLIFNMFIDSFDLNATYLTEASENCDLKTYLKNIENERREVMRTISFGSPLHVEGELWSMKVANYLAIENYSLTTVESISPKDIPDIDFDSQFARFLLGKKSLNDSIEKVFNETPLDQIRYTQKYQMLTMVNPRIPDLFRKIVDSIVRDDLKVEGDAIYVKIEDYLSPYLINGNSGLIIELVKFSLREKTGEFDYLLRKLGMGVVHPYAKSTALYTGLAGLGLANIWLYRYFKDQFYLQNCLTISKHICDFSVEIEGRKYLVDPANKTNDVNLSFSHGLLGQCYFFDELIALLKQILYGREKR